jgi:hypothetical protein
MGRTLTSAAKLFNTFLGKVPLITLTLGVDVEDSAKNLPLETTLYSREILKCPFY